MPACHLFYFRVCFLFLFPRRVLFLCFKVISSLLSQLLCLVATSSAAPRLSRSYKLTDHDENKSRHTTITVLLVIITPKTVWRIDTNEQLAIVYALAPVYFETSIQHISGYAAALIHTQTCDCSAGTPYDHRVLMTPALRVRVYRPRSLHSLPYPLSSLHGIVRAQPSISLLHSMT